MFRHQTTTVHCDDRFLIVTIANYLLVNVYLPCKGTANRTELCDSLLCDIWSWRERFMNYECIIAGDMNTDLVKGNDEIATHLNFFINDKKLTRCNDLFSQRTVATYVNPALNQESCIDYIFASSQSDIRNFEVLDLSLNFSDHLPLLVSIRTQVAPSHVKSNTVTDNSNLSKQLRWDKADILAFYHYTGLQLQPVLASVESMCL